MKKTTINISYDEEKLSALKMYLGQKGSSLDDELVKMLDTLYGKTVPASVREFKSKGARVQPFAENAENRVIRKLYSDFKNEQVRKNNVAACEPPCRPV